MDPHQIQLFLRHLALAGPLLYIGLAMTLDPVGFVDCFRTLARAFADLDRHLHGLFRPSVFRPSLFRPSVFHPEYLPDRRPISAQSTSAIRLVGILLSAAALSLLAA